MSHSLRPTGRKYISASTYRRTCGSWEIDWSWIMDILSNMLVRTDRFRLLLGVRLYLTNLIGGSRVSREIFCRWAPRKNISPNVFGQRAQAVAVVKLGRMSRVWFPDKLLYVVEMNCRVDDALVMGIIWLMAFYWLPLQMVSGCYQRHHSSFR